jgi:hypothetical protein
VSPGAAPETSVVEGVFAGTQWRLQPSEGAAEERCAELVTTATRVAEVERPAARNEGCVVRGEDEPLLLMGLATLESAGFGYVWGFAGHPVARSKSPSRMGNSACNDEQWHVRRLL